MLWIIQSILLGAGLAMDATCVSITNGLIEPSMKKRKMFKIALAFGIFQGIMPLIGYLIGSIFEKFLTNAIPYFALILLSYLGGKMIYEGIKKYKKAKNDEVIEEHVLSNKDLFIQSIATSIDALTIGIIYVGTTMVVAYTTFAIVAIVTFLFCIIALVFGKKLGSHLSNKAEIIGGLILIGIGLKIFIEYLITIL